MDESLALRNDNIEEIESIYKGANCDFIERYFPVSCLPLVDVQFLVSIHSNPKGKHEEQQMQKLDD